jgi:hypothetical protein
MFNLTLRTETASVPDATTVPDVTTASTSLALSAPEATPQLVDVLIDVSDRADSCVITVAGRIIIEQLGHGHEPSLGHDVSLVKGGFRATSGPGPLPDHRQEQRRAFGPRRGPGRCAGSGI